VKGFQVSRKLAKVGNLSSDTALLFFDDCRIPARYVLGEADQGFYQIMTGFQGERLVAAVTAVAASQLLLEDALRYGQERKAFGRPIGTFQAWRHRFAGHLSRVEAARWLTYRAADLFNRKEMALKEISMAKLVACDLAQEVAYDCMQFHGGMGYVTESDVARAWRDSGCSPSPAGRRRSCGRSSRGPPGCDGSDPMTDVVVVLVTARPRRRRGPGADARGGGARRLRQRRAGRALHLPLGGKGPRRRRGAASAEDRAAPARAPQGAAAGAPPYQVPELLALPVEGGLARTSSDRGERAPLREAPRAEARRTLARRAAAGEARERARATARSPAAPGSAPVSP